MLFCDLGAINSYLIIGAKKGKKVKVALVVVIWVQGCFLDVFVNR